MAELIRVLRDASDRYGEPHTLGFLRRYGLHGFLGATQEQLREYIAKEGVE